MKILFACKEFPYAKIIGGPIIIFNRIRILSKNHTVSLAAFATEEQKKYVDTVKPFCHELKLLPRPPKRNIFKALWDFFFSPVPPYFLKTYGSKAMAHTIADMVQQDKYDFVIAEYSVMGQFLYNNPELAEVNRIISVHECYYLARLKDYRHYGLGLKKLREAFNLKGLKKFEFAMYKNADKVLTLTPQGKQELLAIQPGLDIEVVPHGVNTDQFPFSEIPGEDKTLIFVGNYLHFPNVDAVEYFCSDIWPLVKKRIPGIKFLIVGQSPPHDILRLAHDKDIVITGRVDEVFPYIKKAFIFICPVRLGGGFRGKILEAMSAGRPIVSTSLGAQGIPASNRENIILADTPKDFADGIFDLLHDEKLYNTIRTRARDLIEEKFTWDRGVEVLEGVLNKMQALSPAENPTNSGREGA